MRAVISCNVCPLVEPYVGRCWICGEYSILVAHDTSVDESVCMNCIDDAIMVDEELQRLNGGEVAYKHYDR